MFDVSIRGLKCCLNCLNCAEPGEGCLKGYNYQCDCLSKYFNQWVSPWPTITLAIMKNERWLNHVKRAGRIERKDGKR